MSFSNNGYTPKQGDIVYIDFDPSTGREIQKRRPALVISSSIFNDRSGFVAVCPITSRIRSGDSFATLSEHKIKGQIVVAQFRTFDFVSRDIQFVERCSPVEFAKVIMIMNAILGFDNVFDNRTKL